MTRCGIAIFKIKENELIAKMTKCFKQVLFLPQILNRVEK